MSRPAALALVTALLSQALLGCSGNNQPIITVGSQKVTVADYERTARGAQAPHVVRDRARPATYGY